MANPQGTIRTAQSGGILRGLAGQVLTLLSDGVSAAFKPLSVMGLFYQTIEDVTGAGTMPQEPLLRIHNGTLSDDPGVATDLVLQYQQLVNADNDLLPQQPQTKFGPEFNLADEPFGDLTHITAPGIATAQATADVAGAVALAAAAPKPSAANNGAVTLVTGGVLSYLKGTIDQQALRWSVIGAAWLAQVDLQPNIYWVISSLAADASPYFSTVQAAINAAGASGNASVVNLEPGTQYNENIVLPNGKQIVLNCPQQGGTSAAVNAIIIGTVTDTAGAANSNFVFRNVLVQGNITFIGTGATSQLAFDCDLATSGNTGIIVTGAVAIGVYAFRVAGRSPPAIFSASQPYTPITLNAVSGNITCAVLTMYNSGLPLAGGARTLTVSSGCFFQNCNLNVTGLVVTCPSVTLINTTTRSATVPPSFSGEVHADPFSAGCLLGHGFQGAGTLLMLDGSFSKGPTAFAANLAATKIVLLGTPSAGMYEIKGDMVKTVAGTAGVASLNVNYTDAAGAVSVPICTMDVLTGLRAGGSVVFESTGAADITLSITGITTPGTLAATWRVNLRKVNSQVA